MAWDVAADYDYCKTNDKYYWAWEFLRRNESYIALYKHIEKAYLGDDYQGDIVAFPLDGFGPEERSPVSFSMEYELFIISSTLEEKLKLQFEIPLESHLQVFYSPLVDRPRALPMKGACYVPVNRDDAANYVAVIDGNSEEHRHLISKATNELAKNTMYCIVDLSASLETQFKDFLRIAKKLRNRHKIEMSKSMKITAKRKNDWIKCLRCLDALSAGIKRSEAACVIFKQDDPLSSWDVAMKRARKMCDKAVWNWINDFNSFHAADIERMLSRLKQPL